MNKLNNASDQSKKLPNEEKTRRKSRTERRRNLVNEQIRKITGGLATAQNVRNFDSAIVQIARLENKPGCHPYPCIRYQEHHIIATYNISQTYAV